MNTTHTNRLGVTAGFSLVELLVVIAIIAVLISVLLPSLSRASEQARRVKCAGQARGLQIATIMYGNDHKGYVPDAGVTGNHGLKCDTRKVLFDNYGLSNPRQWWCPSILNRGLAYYKTVRTSMDPKWFNDPTAVLGGLNWSANHRAVTGYDYFLSQLRGWTPGSASAVTYNMPLIHRFSESTSPSERIAWGDPLGAPGDSGWNSNWSAPLNPHDARGNFISEGANYAMLDGHVQWREYNWGVNTHFVITNQYFIYK